MADPVLNFEFLGLCFYKRGDIRPPKRGEYYLSGAIVAAYKAFSDLASSYQIVTPTHKALPTNGYVRGKPILQRDHGSFN